jgi:guanylate kinase
MASGNIFVFSAPSGAGKSTLLNRLVQCVPDLVYSISATTRSPRPGEQEGKHYFFLSAEQFLKKRDRGDFAEWEQVHGNYYGTPRSFIEATTAQGKHIVMDIDVFGKKKLDGVYPNAIGILILPPSMAELEKRLRDRNTEDEATLKLRLNNAHKEMEFARNEGKYEFTLVNDDLEGATHTLVEMVSSCIASKK